jgi:hypothetical protein
MAFPSCSRKRWADMVSDDDNETTHEQKAPPLRTRRLYVRNLDLMKTITVMWRGSDTLDYVRTKIQDKFSIHPDQQRLIWWKKELEGDCRLSDYNIKDGSTLHVCDRMDMQIQVQTQTGKTSTMHVVPSLTVFVLKQRIENQERVPIG